MRRFYARLGVDGLLAAAFVVLAAFAFLQTYTFPQTAATWPRWVIGSFAGLSGLLVVLKLAFGGKAS